MWTELPITGVKLSYLLRKIWEAVDEASLGEEHVGNMLSTNSSRFGPIYWIILDADIDWTLSDDESALGSIQNKCIFM